MNDHSSTWQSTDDFFAQSTEHIAEGLKEASSTQEEALKKLIDYLNHPTTELTDDDRERLMHVKVKLRHLYEAH